MIVAGGAYAAGAFNASQFHTDSPAGAGVGQGLFSAWLQLVNDPLGRPYKVLRSFCSHRDYVLNSLHLRAEVQQKTSVTAWGQTYLYQWRMVVPPDWVNLGAGSYALVLQLHDLNAAELPRGPAAMAEIIDGNVLRFITNRTDQVSREVYRMNVTPGQEIEVSWRVRWANEVNEPAANGISELFIGDALVWSEYGQKTTWDNDEAAQDTTVPVLKCGLYQPTGNASWWTGKSLWMHYVAATIATGDETPASVRAFVDSSLLMRSNTPRKAFAARQA